MSEGLDLLVGAWELRSCTATHPDGSRHHLYGSAPTGVIMYTPDGWMSCHMAGGGEADASGTMVAYSGYFGPVVIRPDESIVEHHVRHATTQWMLGTVQERSYRVEGSTLFLSAKVGDNQIEVAWSRERA